MSRSREEELYKAAEAGRLEDVQHLLGLDSAASGGYIDIDWMNPDSCGRTPLCIASFEGHLSVATLLLEHGADANKANSIGYTPLYMASLKDHTSVVALLLEHGADVNKEYKDGYTPLHVASGYGHTSVAILLLEHGADVHKEDYRGETPLHRASWNGHAPVIAQLLQHGACVDIDKTTERGKTPLFLASSHRRTTVVSLLLQHGADLGEELFCLETPFSIAVKDRSHDIVKLILQRYIDMYEQQNYSGFIPPALSLTSKDDEYIPEDDLLLKEAQSEVATRSRILCLLHVLFETWVVNLTDDEVTSMLVNMLILERI